MKVWSTITVVGLIGVCVVNVVATVRRVPPAPRLPLMTSANVVMRQEERMAKLRRALQSRGVRGTIGYLADVSAAELAAQPRGMEEYFLTQFALVPWVLDAKAADCEWIVANLHIASITERKPVGFRVVEDFGNGVSLLQKMERPAP